MTPPAATKQTRKSKKPALPELPDDPEALTALLAAIKAKLPDHPLKPRKDDAGGLVDVLSLDDLLTYFDITNKWDSSAHPRRYYASQAMNCFRKQWYKDRQKKGLIDFDAGEDDEFDAGKARPGNAMENEWKYLMAEILNYGKEGVVLNDIRFSDSFEVVVERPDGSETEEVVHIIAKSDPMVVGDNMRVLALYEFKGPFYWKSAMSDITAAVGTKQVPLDIAMVEEPGHQKGVVNVNNLAQICIEIALLAKHGNAPKRAHLVYCARNLYRDHIEIMITKEQALLMYDMVKWWLQEHHNDLAQPDPPGAQFFMGYECKYCPFAKRCAADSKRNGDEGRRIHPIMVGINDRLRKASLAGPTR